MNVSITHKITDVAAMLALAGSLTATGTISATAATPACGTHCISIFSKELGNYKQPGVVEAVFDGPAAVGQVVILKQGSSLDTWEDLVPTGGHVVSDFYKSGMVSAEVNARYGSLKAAQIEYAPEGKPTGLCVGLSKTAYENEGLTLQPCSVPVLTVWIIDTADSPTTAGAGYFPIVNASTTDLTRPYAMSLSQTEIANHETLRIYVAQLQFQGADKTPTDQQLWGAHFGVLTP
ncbi:MAG: hypothetical protein WCC84_00645 [Candidatus Cybelea sp.]